MNKIKVSIYILAVLALLAGAASAQTNITIGSGSAVLNGTVIVPLMINNVTDVGVADINLTYNASVVHVTDAPNNSQFDFVDSNIDNATGVTRIGAVQMGSAGLNGSVKVADVTLMAVGAQGSSSTINITINELKDASPAQNVIPASVVNGSFNVQITDITPPASITNLTNITYAQTYINWTWTNPGDADFAKVMVYLNGTFQTDVTSPANYYNATGLTADTQYNISTHTVDTFGNINQTWVNHTARTKPAPIPTKLALFMPSKALKGTQVPITITVQDQFGDNVTTDSGIKRHNITLTTSTATSSVVEPVEVKPGIEFRTNLTDSAAEIVTIAAVDLRGILKDGSGQIEFISPVAKIAITTNKTQIVGNMTDLAEVAIQLKDVDNKNVNLSTTVEWVPVPTGKLAIVTSDSQTDNNGVAKAIVSSFGLDENTLGNATVRAFVPNKEANVNITVIKGPPEDANSTAIVSANQIQAGKNITLNMTIRDGQNRILENIPVTFSTNTINSKFSNGLTTYTANTDNAGNLSIVYTTSRNLVNTSLLANNITITTSTGNVSRLLVVTSLGPHNGTTTVANSTADGTAKVNTIVNFTWTLRDANGDPLGGEQVSITTNTPEASIISADTATNSTTGNASAELKLSQIAGVNNITLVSSIGNVNQTVVIRGIADNYTKINVSSDGSNIVKQGSFNLSIFGQLKDQFNNDNRTAGLQINYSATFTGSGLENVPIAAVNARLLNKAGAEATFELTDANGTATMILTPPNKTGTINITLSMKDAPSINGTIAIPVREASGIKLTPSKTTANLSEAVNITAQLIDDSGSEVGQTGENIAYFLSGGGSLNPLSGVTNTAGAHITVLTAPSVHGVVTVAASTASGFTNSTQISVVQEPAAPGAISKLFLNGSPPSIVAGASDFNRTKITISLRDATGMLNTTSGVQILVTTTAGTFDGGATTKTVSTVSGIASVNLTSSATPGTAMAAATASFTGNPNGTLNVNFEGVATKLSMFVNPAVLNEGGTAIVTVVAKDANNNNITHFVSPVTVNLTTNRSGAALAAASLLLNEANSGVNFTTLTDSLVENVLVTASNTGLSSGTANVSFTEPAFNNKIYLREGWNFISVPKKLDAGKDKVDTFFSGVPYDAIMSYDALNRSFVLLAVPGLIIKNDTMEPLRSYWVHLPQGNAASISLIYDPTILIPPTLQLFAGWNAVGHTRTTVATAEEAFSSVDSSWSIALGFNPDGQSYEAAIVNGVNSNMSTTPGRGYWLWLVKPDLLAGQSG